MLYYKKRNPFTKCNFYSKSKVTQIKYNYKNILLLVLDEFILETKLSF